MAWDKTPGARRDLPPDWWKIVAQVKKAAGGRCEKILPSGRRCPRRGRDVDHVGDPHDHRPSNLRLLCEDHHKQRTAKQALAARTRGGTPKKTTPKRHPGQLRRQTGD